MMNNLQTSAEGQAKSYFHLNEKDNGELAVLCYNILLSAQNAIPLKSWTTRMLSLGAFTILKKVTEEMVEFVIAVCRDSPSGVCEECSDLIYHILLLFVGFEINYEEMFLAKINQIGVAASSLHSEKTMFNLRDVNVNGYSSSAALTLAIRKLYLSVSSLTSICLLINTKTSINKTTVTIAVREVFINVMTLLRYRAVRYQEVANVLIARCNH
ncbi:MAG: phosphoribosyl-ATP diphosphatase [Candidatus Hodgkinia cicadicola]